MAENQSTEAGAAEGTKAEKQLANIVRGTLPKVLVYMIRHTEDAGTKESDVAKKYGTTNGKIADIRKNRNFAYIDADFRPTQEDKDAGVKWLKQVPNYDEVGTDAVVTALEAIEVGSEEHAKALAEKRAAVRARNAATSAEGGAEGGEPKAAKSGGKKNGGSKAKGQKEPADADTLMS